MREWVRIDGRKGFVTQKYFVMTNREGACGATDHIQQNPQSLTVQTKANGKRLAVEEFFALCVGEVSLVLRELVRILYKLSFSGLVL